jgi:PTS system beta-glucosides-specific IIC component
LEGEFFTPLVSEGQFVSEGQALIRFEREKIEQAGYDSVVMCVVANSNKFQVSPVAEKVQVDKNDIIMMVEENA